VTGFIDAHMRPESTKLWIDEFGIRVAAPFTLLSFLGLSVIPVHGLIDVNRWSPSPVGL